MKIGGRKLVGGRKDKRIFRRTAVKRSRKDCLVARGGNYN